MTVPRSESDTMSNPPESLPDHATGPATTLPPVVSDAACTACGCLCDDIGLAVQDGRIVAADHACELGLRWFLADHDQGGLPVATLAGRAADAGEALDHAAEILRQARAPVVL